MADRLFIPRKLWVDLTEFGFGVREVPVITGGGVPGPDSVGTDEIINGSVMMEDLHEEVQRTIEKLKNLVETEVDEENGVIRLKINDV